MRLSITYKDGAAFEVAAETEEEIELLLNTALKVLWPNAKAMSLDETAKWLGWKR